MISNEFQPIVERCVGCAHIIPILEVPPVNLCRVYLYPEAKWGAGNCPMASHLQKKVEEKKFVDPLKASKQKAKGK